MSSELPAHCYRSATHPGMVRGTGAESPCSSGIRRIHHPRVRVRDTRARVRLEVVASQDGSAK